VRLLNRKWTPASTMSSEISTDKTRRRAAPASGGAPASTDEAARGASSVAAARLPDDAGLQPWHFFVLAALGCATAVTFLVRSQGVVAVILLSIMMGTTALVGLAMLRTVRPLVSPGDDRTAVIGQRTRAALEREKSLTLRAIKELEFDRAMGKVSEEDFREMTGRMRARATRLIRQLDASAGYRGVIERDLSKRLGEVSEAVGGPQSRGSERICGSCTTANDTDARFCKSCGAKL
jgi:hypothetical protein